VTAAADNLNTDYAAAAEEDTTAIAASFTLQLSGSVDSGWFSGVDVEAIDTGNTW